MDRTVQTQTSNELTPELVLEALIAGVRILDAHQNPDKTLNRLQKYLEAGAQELDINPAVVGKMFRRLRDEKTKKESGEKRMPQDQDRTCSCEGYTYEKYASGARGGKYRACMSCGKAIRPENDDSGRYFAAKLERWCSCSNRVPAKQIPYHQVWCKSRRDEFPGLHKD